MPLINNKNWVFDTRAVPPESSAAWRALLTLFGLYSSTRQTEKRIRANDDRATLIPAWVTRAVLRAVELQAHQRIRILAGHVPFVAMDCPRVPHGGAGFGTTYACHDLALRLVAEKLACRIEISEAVRFSIRSTMPTTQSEKRRAMGAAKNLRQICNLLVNAAARPRAENRAVAQAHLADLLLSYRSN